MEKLGTKFSDGIARRIARRMSRECDGIAMDSDRAEILRAVQTKIQRVNAKEARPKRTRIRNTVAARIARDQKRVSAIRLISVFKRIVVAMRERIGAKTGQGCDPGHRAAGANACVTF